MKRMMRVIMALLLLLLASVFTFAQQKLPVGQPKQEVELGRGMSLIAPGLMQAGQETNFFLQLAEQIQLTEQQRAALEEVVYEFQKYSVQKLADLNVGEAELERLLTRETIDLAAVRAKVKEVEAIAAEVKIRKIEALLKAIKVLTHEQHLKVVTLSPSPQVPKPRLQSERVYE